MLLALAVARTKDCLNAHVSLFDTSSGGMELFWSWVRELGHFQFHLPIVETLGVAMSKMFQGTEKQFRYEASQEAQNIDIDAMKTQLKQLEDDINTNFTSGNWFAGDAGINNWKRLFWPKGEVEHHGMLADILGKRAISKALAAMLKDKAYLSVSALERNIPAFVNAPHFTHRLNSWTPLVCRAWGSSEKMCVWVDAMPKALIFMTELQAALENQANKLNNIKSKILAAGVTVGISVCNVIAKKVIDDYSGEGARP